MQDTATDILQSLSMTLQHAYYTIPVADEHVQDSARQCVAVCVAVCVAGRIAVCVAECLAVRVAERVAVQPT